MTTRKTKDKKTCSECQSELAEGGYVHRYVIGDDVCNACMKKQYPEHITEPESGFDTKVVRFVTINGGDPDEFVLAFDSATGMAAIGASKKAASERLQYVFRTVQHYEDNERYGSIME